MYCRSWSSGGIVRIGVSDVTWRNLEDKVSGPTDPKPSGRTVDEAVAKAEDGSQIEGVHTPSGQAASGESRVEKMADVDGVAESQAEGHHGDTATTPEPEP